MSDTINITVVDDVAYINLTITEQPPINISFSDIAVADPEVALARDAADASAENAINAAAIAAQAVLDAQEVVTNATESIAESSIVNALIFG